MPQLTGTEVRKLFKSKRGGTNEADDSKLTTSAEPLPASGGKTGEGTSTRRMRSQQRSGSETKKRAAADKAQEEANSPEENPRKRQRGVVTDGEEHSATRKGGQEKRAGRGATKATSNAESKPKKGQKQKSPSSSIVPIAVKVHKSSSSQRCAFLLAHGAGGKSDSPGMARYIEMLLEHGDVVTFDYPGNRLDTYTPIHLSAAKQAAALYPDRPLFLAGNSMGCRGSVNVVNALAAESSLSTTLSHLAGLIFFSYPLIKLPHPPLSDAQRREREPPLLALPAVVRCLFLAGTRDAFLDKSIPALKKLVAQMAAQCEVHEVEGGDHGLKGKRQPELENGIRDAIRAFVASPGSTAAR